MNIELTNKREDVGLTSFIESRFSGYGKIVASSGATGEGYSIEQGLYGFLTPDDISLGEFWYCAFSFGKGHRELRTLGASGTFRQAVKLLSDVIKMGIERPYRDGAFLDCFRVAAVMFRTQGVCLGFCQQCGEPTYSTGDVVKDMQRLVFCDVCRAG
jgi:hypothetical protein